MSAATSASNPSSSGAMRTDLLHAFWSAVVSAPWLAALLAVVLLVAAVHCVRHVVHAGHAPDPVRAFSGADRQIIFERAGGRCEFVNPVFGRCHATANLHADHVHPHSRGGATHLRNAQALCSHHNLVKSAHVPWDWQLARLAKRRIGYFPPGHDPIVARYLPTPPVDGAHLSRRPAVSAPSH